MFPDNIAHYREYEAPGLDKRSRGEGYPLCQTFWLHFCHPVRPPGTDRAASCVGISSSCICNTIQLSGDTLTSSRTRPQEIMAARERLVVPFPRDRHPGQIRCFMEGGCSGPYDYTRSSGNLVPGKNRSLHQATKVSFQLRLAECGIAGLQKRRFTLNG